MAMDFYNPGSPLGYPGRVTENSHTIMGIHQLKSHGLIEAVFMISFDSMLSKHMSSMHASDLPFLRIQPKKLEDGPPKSFTITKEKIRKV